MSKAEEVAPIKKKRFVFNIKSLRAYATSLPPHNAGRKTLLRKESDLAGK
jgi:hypothetical protein